MINLIVLGNSDGSSLANAIYQILRPSFQVAYIREGGKVSGCAESPDFLLLECDRIHTGNGAHSIILCKPRFAIPFDRCAVSEDGAVGVLQTENRNAAEMMSRWGIPAVSCGMSVTDTVTLSSIDADSAMVCLQRNIPTLDGGSIEPFEIPLRLSRPIDRYALMCAVSLLLISGNASKLDGLSW